MKITICDICAVEGTITRTNKYWRKRGQRGMHVFVCAKHDTWPKGKTDLEWLALINKAEAGIEGAKWAKG